MADILNIIDPDEQDPKKFLESIRYNFLKVGATNLKAGAYQLLALKVSTAQNVSSATYTNLTQFAGSFNASGGLVNVCGAVIAITNGNLAVLELYIDDFAVANFTQSSTTLVVSSVPITYSGQLSAGKHTWRIKAKADTGTATFGFYSPSGSTSNISITEFLRG